MYIQICNLDYSLHSIFCICKTYFVRVYVCRYVCVQLQLEYSWFQCDVINMTRNGEAFFEVGAKVVRDTPAENSGQPCDSTLKLHLPLFHVTTAFVKRSFLSRKRKSSMWRNWTIIKLRKERNRYYSVFYFKNK